MADPGEKTYRSGIRCQDLSAHRYGWPGGSFAAVHQPGGPLLRWLLALVVALTAGCVQGRWVKEGATDHDAERAYVQCRNAIDPHRQRGWANFDPFAEDREIADCMARQGYSFGAK